MVATLIAGATVGFMMIQERQPIVSLIMPRMAVAYHFFNDFDTQERVGLGIRSTHDGPLTLAEAIDVDENLRPHQRRIRYGL